MLSYIGGVRGNEVEGLFVRRVLEQRTALADLGVRIRLVGNGSETFREEAEQSQGVLELVGFLPQAELGLIWRESSALLIFLPRSKGRLGWVPQKLYPYLASGHPILAFVPPGEARDYLSQAGGHVIRDPEDYDLLEAIDCVVRAGREDEPGHPRSGVGRALRSGPALRPAAALATGASRGVARINPEAALRGRRASAALDVPLPP